MKELIDLGFTPAAALAIMAVIALAVVVKRLHTKNEENSTARHAETRAQVDDLRIHTERCEKDREDLRKDLAIIKDRTDRCPTPNCSFRPR